MNRGIAFLPLAMAAIAFVVAAPPPPDLVGCAAELVAASACLPHLAALPDEDRAPPAPSAACCKAVVSAIIGAGGGPACLCHLVRRPDLFGFPVNASRVASLFSSCSTSGPAVAADSFTEFCRGAQALPPLRSDTSATMTKPGTAVDAVTPPPTDEPGRSSNPDLVVSHPPSASAQAQVCSLRSLLSTAIVLLLLSVSSR